MAWASHTHFKLLEILRKISKVLKKIDDHMRKIALVGSAFMGSCVAVPLNVYSTRPTPLRLSLSYCLHQC